MTELDKIMTLVFDAEKFLKTPQMSNGQYQMAADKLKEAREKYLAYRANEQERQKELRELGLKYRHPVSSLIDQAANLCRYFC